MGILPTEEEKMDSLRSEVQYLKERLESSLHMNNELLLIEDEKGGYTAFFKEIPKVVTQGETKDEAYHNLICALHDIVEHDMHHMTIFRDAIIDAYQSGAKDGYNEMYNSDYASSRMMEKPIVGEVEAVAKIMGKYIGE